MSKARFFTLLPGETSKARRHVAQPGDVVFFCPMTGHCFSRLADLSRWTGSRNGCPAVSGGHYTADPHPPITMEVAMKMKGFSGLKQAMEDTGLYDEPVYTGLRRADKVRELTHVGKARRTPEPPLYAEVKVRAITKRKATKKPDNGPGGKWFAHAEPTLDWYLRRLQG